MKTEQSPPQSVDQYCTNVSFLVWVLQYSYITYHYWGKLGSQDSIYSFCIVNLLKNDKLFLKTWFPLIHTFNLIQTIVRTYMSQFIPNYMSKIHVLTIIHFSYWRISQVFIQHALALTSNTFLIYFVIWFLQLQQIDSVQPASHLFIYLCFFIRNILLIVTSNMISMTL